LQQIRRWGVFIGGMKLENVKGPEQLEKGQVWKTEHGYLYIEQLGHRVSHYKLMRHPEQKVVSTRLITIEALGNFLRTSDAHLLNGPAESPGRTAVTPAAV
jgi:hypothetical protein